ncbi:hypothetical protein PA7_26040 [Pseudonocardia asaccharolytica DSM 44247 = NBRC 16224]|uniref:Uncharacterized protein n=1 Tax=Pseudonocardia asaccharolytica DSM 44247 = NBRC 16224 TaxID=1123024 RepID=A0A511D254_9PSEU|nr:hypothetical protein PA7_26040 [Pseudonocardia asaccharolytica DSM 44247 = NBRC 16224]
MAADGFAERGAILHWLADLMIEHADELAIADTCDMGKPIWTPGTTPTPGSSRPGSPRRSPRGTSR